MKTSTKITSAIALLILVTAIIIGCATKNPNAGQVTVTPGPNGTLVTNVQPQYIPNQTVTTVAGYGNQAAPFIPPPYGTALTGVLALTTTIAGIFAVKANNKAAAATATTNQLAASVVAQGPTVTQAVSDHASANEAVFPSVADAINRKSI